MPIAAAAPFVATSDAVVLVEALVEGDPALGLELSERQATTVTRPLVFVAFAGDMLGY